MMRDNICVRSHAERGHKNLTIRAHPCPSVVFLFERGMSDKTIFRLMKRFFSYALCLGLLLGGCGYTLVGQGNLPEHIETIAIPIFENETLEEGVEETLTNFVIEEFVKGGKVRLVSEDRADAILLGVVKTYKNKEAVTYNEQNKVSSYKVTVTVDVQLQDLVEEKILWEQEGLSENADYDGGEDVGLTEEQENEREALRQLTEEMAQKIRTLSTEGF